MRAVAAIRSPFSVVPDESRWASVDATEPRQNSVAQGCIHCSLNSAMSSAVTTRPGETLMRPGSPATAIPTLARVRCRSLLVITSETVGAVGAVGGGGSVKVTWPVGGAAGTGWFATVRVGKTGHPFGTLTDQVKVVRNERSVSRLKEEGDAVKRPVISAAQSGGGGGPSEPPEG